MKGTEWYLLCSKFFLIRLYLGVFLHLENLLSLEENFKNILSRFHFVQSIEQQLFKVTHLAVECFIAYSETMFVTSPIDL